MAAALQGVAFAAAIGTPPGQTAGTRTDISNSPYARGLEGLVAGDLAAAQRAFEEAGKAEPKLAAPLLGQAEVAFKRKNLDEARRLIERAIEVQPASSDAHASLGRYLVTTGKPKEAEASLRKAANLDAKALRPRIDLADLLAGQQNWAEALLLYEQCVAIDPRHAGAHYALGVAYGRTGKMQEAIAALERSAGLDPKNPLPHLALARVHAGSKAYKQALAAVGEALQRQPNLFEALMLRADLLDASDQSDAAITAFERAAKASPKSAAPHLRIGMLHHRSGKDAAALAAYMKGVELEPKSALAHNNIADLHARRKDGLAEAERWAAKAVALAPQAADPHDTLGWIQRARGNLPAARASLERASSLAPQNGEIGYHLAQVYADLGERDRARQTLRGAMAAPGGVKSVEPARKLMAELGG